MERVYKSPHSPESNKLLAMKQPWMEPWISVPSRFFFLRETFRNIWGIYTCINSLAKCIDPLNPPVTMVHSAWFMTAVYRVKGMWWETVLCIVNGACEATLWMERIVRGGAGLPLLTLSPSRAVCNAAVPFHTLVQLVPYFILSVHTAATLIPPLETNYTANHTRTGSVLLSILP